ncbi:MAG: TraB/GumN family protein [Azospirillaceae bacterium]
MKRLLAACLLLLAMPVAAPAQSPGDAPSYSDSLLWHLRHPNGNAGYLFGTMHVGDPRAIALVERLRGPIEEVDVVYTELSFAEAEAMSGEMMALIFDASRPPLDEVLGEALFARLLAELEPYGINAAALRNMPAWLAGTLTFYPDQMSAGTFVDVEVEALARELDRPVHGLESVEEQLAVLRDLGEAEPVAMIEGALDFLQDNPDAAEEITDAYVAGDLPTVWSLALGAMAYGNVADNEALMQSALYDRNQVMAERIGAVMAGRAALFAIGAAHLPDEGGVLDLLVGQGFQVQPVPLGGLDGGDGANGGMSGRPKG